LRIVHHQESGRLAGQRNHDHEKNDDSRESHLIANITKETSFRSNWVTAVIKIRLRVAKIA